MKTKKLIRYRIPISRTFPTTHKRKGISTFFIEKIFIGLGKIIPCELCCPNTSFMCEICTQKSLSWAKLHTIRTNLPLWEKRFKKIMAGEAVLELYYWSGKPYNSKCVTICQLGKDDGIGIQKLEFNYGIVPFIDKPGVVPFNRCFLKIWELAKNDGLSLDDFEGWFKNYDLEEPLAIIHFSPFRY
jgi:hypothetical protein